VISSGLLILTGIEINEKGDVDYIWLDPRDAIFEEIVGDNFLKKSTVRGGRQWMPIHEVLVKFTLDPEDRKKLESCRDNPGVYYGNNRFRVKQMNNQCMVEVVH